MKDGKPFRTTGYQHKINKNSLVLKDVRKFDEGKYSCEINNGVQKLSYDIRFIVTRKQNKIYSQKKQKIEIDVIKVNTIDI